MWDVPFYCILGIFKCLYQEKKNVPQQDMVGLNYFVSKKTASETNAPVHNDVSQLNAFNTVHYRDSPVSLITC